MKEELKRIGHSLFQATNFEILRLQQDDEAEEYSGYNFQLGAKSIKFRKAKTTPIKTGHFVTLWRRNFKGNTEPFRLEDIYEFYVFAVRKERNSGFFIFPKSVLAHRRILISEKSSGKRGFRLYAEWDSPQSKQALETKSWQAPYFINFSQEQQNVIDRVRVLLTGSDICTTLLS